MASELALSAEGRRKGLKEQKPVGKRPLKTERRVKQREQREQREHAHDAQNVRRWDVDRYKRPLEKMRGITSRFLAGGAFPTLMA